MSVSMKATPTRSLLSLKFHINIYSIHVHVYTCIYMHTKICNVRVHTDFTPSKYSTVYVVPRQDSMSPARANAVLSGHCNRFVGYP